MTDYERGSAAWDIGMILTRHDHAKCARAHSLQTTARQKKQGVERLRLALETVCTCGSGDNPSERSSLELTKETRHITASIQSR